MKKIISICTSVVLAFSTFLPVYADTTGQEIQDVIDFINEGYYYKDDLDKNELYEAALTGIFSHLDQYSEYYNADELKEFDSRFEESQHVFGFTLGFDEPNIRFYIEEVIPGSPAAKAGLKAGDIISKIDGYSVTTEDEIFNFDYNNFGVSPNMTLVVDRGYELATIKMTSADLSDISVMKSDLYDMGYVKDKGKYGYIKISTFGKGTADEFSRAVSSLNSCDSIVLDLRDNGGGLMDAVLEISDMILPAGKIMTVKYSNGFTETLYSENKNVPFKKIVVLVNEYTASASEVLASALQDSGIGIVVGDSATTYGKGVIQGMYWMERDDAFKLTIAEYLSRNGKVIQDVGVKVDVLLDDVDIYYDETVKSQWENVNSALGYLGVNAGDTYESTDKALKSFVAAKTKDKKALATDKGNLMVLGVELIRQDYILKQAVTTLLK